MKRLMLLSGAALLLAASPAGAQTNPAGHAQHHATKHSARMSGSRCSCQHEMHEMMSMMHQMMRMHGGMKMRSGMNTHAGMKMHSGMKSHESMNMPKEGGMNMPAPSTGPVQNPPADPHQR